MTGGGAEPVSFERVRLPGSDHHGVVDFIVVNYWPGKRWPAFNIADAAIVCGVIALVADALFRPKAGLKEGT